MTENCSFRYYHSLRTKGPPFPNRTKRRMSSCRIFLCRAPDMRNKVEREWQGRGNKVVVQTGGPVPIQLPNYYLCPLTNQDVSQRMTIQSSGVRVEGKRGPKPQPKKKGPHGGHTIHSIRIERRRDRGGCLGHTIGQEVLLGCAGYLHECKVVEEKWRRRLQVKGGWR